MGTPNRMFFKLAIIFMLVSPLAVLGSPLLDYFGPPPPAPRRFQTFPAYGNFDNIKNLLPADFDRSAGPVFDDLSAPLRAEEMDNIIAPRKTKNGGRLLGGLFESFLAPFLDIIKNLFGGDTDA